MITVSKEAAQFIGDVVRRSGVPNPVVSIVAATAPLKVTDELVRAIKSGNRDKLRSELPALSGDTRLEIAVFPRAKFSRWNLVVVSGLTLVIPLYMRLLFSLRIDYRDGKLTFSDRKGRPVYP